MKKIIKNNFNATFKVNSYTTIDGVVHNVD
mgnify:CR=1 FL=1